MARLISIVMIIGIALVPVLTAEELYSDKYDDIDVKYILENNKLREQYYGCFIGNVPCRTPDMKFYKGVIDEAIITQCQKCTEKQKENLNAVADWYVKNQPEKYDAFVAKVLDDAKKKNADQ